MMTTVIKNTMLTTQMTAQTTMITTMTMMIMMMDGGVRQIERIECSLLPTFCTVWPHTLLMMTITVMSDGDYDDWT